MRILLVGEYSRLHNSLKEGLTQLGHQAVIVGTGDGFKQYGTDFSIAPKFVNSNGLFRFFVKAFHKMGINLEEAEKGWRFYKLLPKLKGFDYVQLINSNAIETYPWLAKRLYKKLLQQNGPMSLLICGDDTPIVDYCLTGKLKYSILTPYQNNKSLKKSYAYTLKYTQNNYRSLFEWVKDKAANIITSDLDYEVPMKALGYTTTFIPNPINTDAIAFKPAVVHNKVIIFLGINRHSYTKKGLSYFEDALKIIADKYPDAVELIVTENIPYNEYVKLYDSAHILLDQVYAYDQGYNALEAMAKGKVVFTGAETEFTQHYALTQEVAINAVPNTDTLVTDLSFFIENPDAITALSQRARTFIEKEHNYLVVAKKYLGVWGAN
ncbi:glycosyltransferase family protein [Flavobacterium subsaxonicum]|uniref:Glycosyl transferase family 1 n=1 Tax=Flavobacterium subsaxonicum WB 4.1-42 = DSM 21790 TaxID=1121898 RepID=A0A0A2MJW5_9FLAO|nr:glycosyltransferase [Flavobacterium subsaxonicum]KGO92574.1 glycosyl transferase family 1 [Flavobacterium subsaxonicum WB 4.1-42 = DSM 21790]